MKKINFTKEHYVRMWAKILDTYQWWGNDLTSILDSIGKTNPTVQKAFECVYTENEGTYVLRSCKNITKFYQKLNELIPTSKELYIKLVVESLKAENDDISVRDENKLDRYDYLLAILCFIEEFAFLPLTDKKVSSNGNLLSAHSKNIDIFIEKDKKTEVTTVRITIPCELCIEYNSSEKPFS